MKSGASIVYNFCLVIGDFLALVIAFVGGYLVRGPLSTHAVSHPVHFHTYLVVFLALLPFWILIFALLGLYTSSIYEKRFNEIGRLALGTFIGFLFVIFWNFLSVNPIFPAKLVPIYGMIFGFVVLVIFRNLARLIRTGLFSYDIGITHILIVGNTSVSDELVESLKNSHRSGYKVLGVIGDRRRDYRADYATFEEALEAIKDTQLHGIVQTELYADEARNQEILEYAQKHHISYRFIPGNTELFVGNIDVELFRSSIPVINVRQTALFGWGRVVKRLADIIFGILFIILSSPIFLVVAIMVKLSGGSVFFRQTRLTRYNRKFGVYKFRTVKTEYNGLTPEEAFTEMGRPALIKEYRDNGDFLANDPRYSKFSLFLRASSLDELPQLFNVLKGDLSLVGPRALIPQELSVYEKRHNILAVKSGMTGLAQVSGRRDISFEERRKLDLYYVQNWSIWLDLIIIIKTIRVVLDRTGAK